MRKYLLVKLSFVVSLVSFGFGLLFMASGIGYRSIDLFMMGVSYSLVSSILATIVYIILKGVHTKS